MKYWLIKLEEEKYWFEIEGECVHRQIILDEYHKYHISCLEDCLAEGGVREEDLDGDISVLTKQEFEIVWNSVLKEYDNQWEETKKKYPIGTIVQGVNQYIYPQGIIVKGKDFRAIYKGKNRLFGTNELVQYSVKSYDDINMWLIIE